MLDQGLWFLLALAALLAGARLCGALAARAGLPRMVGELGAGIVAGKTILGRLAPEPYRTLFDEGAQRLLLGSYAGVSVVMLLLVAGIEIDLTVARRSTKAVLLASALGVLVSFGMGFALAWALGDDSLADPSQRASRAAVLGVVLSMSALSIAGKALLDAGLLKTDLGLLVLSAAAIGDLVVWAGYSLLARPAALGSPLLSIALTLGFGAVVLLAGRPLIDRALERAQTRDDSASGGVLSLVTVLALAGAATAEAIGLHAAFGGFAMSVAIGDSGKLREHARAVLRDFVTSVFSPVLFATILLHTDLVRSFDLGLTAVVIAVAFAGKVVGAGVGARLAGLGPRESAAVGFGTSARGGLGVLIAALAREANLIGEPMFVALVVAAIATTLVAGPAMAYVLRPPVSPVLPLLRSGIILLDVPAESRAALIRTLTGTLILRLGHSEDVGRVADEVMQREDQAGTGVGDGVAIPHAAIPGFTEPALAFARTEQGLDFNAPDGQEVRLVFLLLNAEREFALQLRILAAIARLLTQEEVRRGLLAAEDEDDVLALLEDADRATAEVAAARRPRTSLG